MRRYRTIEDWINSDCIWRRLSGYIQKFKKDNQMNNEELAELIGVCQGTLSKYLRYNGNWRADSMLKVCRAIELSPVELMRGTEWEL